METYQEKIKTKLNVVPLEPGCYLMKDRNDQVIYVGKAKNYVIDYVLILRVRMMLKQLA